MEAPVICDACRLPFVDWTDDLVAPPEPRTSVFVGDFERELHWSCFEAENASAQARLFG